jgi:hypothetical protein
LLQFSKEKRKSSREDLSSLPSLKAGWNGATFYAVKDLDRLALKVHGPDGLAKKKLARQKRLDKKMEKAKAPKKKKTSKPAKKRERHERDVANMDDDDDDVEDGLLLHKKQHKATKDDDDFVPDDT